MISLVGAGVLGTVTTGFLASGDGGLGVVAVVVELDVVVAGVIAAWVAPAEGAGWMPGALELPHPARPTPARASREVISVFRVRIRRSRLASGRKRCVIGPRLRRAY